MKILLFGLVVLGYSGALIWLARRCKREGLPKTVAHSLLIATPVSLFVVMPLFAWNESLTLIEYSGWLALGIMLPITALIAYDRINVGDESEGILEEMVAIKDILSLVFSNIFLVIAVAMFLLPMALSHLIFTLISKKMRGELSEDDGF
ncbi:MAG: hypothetical protein WC460_04100 [Patescibacteria group bacterium]